MTAVCLGLPGTVAVAQQASSSAYGLSANENVSAAGVVNANVSVGPISQAAGAAPPTYNNSNTIASVSQNAALTTGVTGVTQGLQTGILTSSASGNATGAQATATVNNLQLSEAQAGLLSDLLNLSATTISSTSQASSLGGLSASGSTTIEGLTLYGLLTGNQSIDGSLFVNPAPNTVLLSIAGLSIILNEQTMLGDGVTGIGISTNAIDVGFNNFALGTNVLNGNVILGHSQAFASLASPAAVPEPATWAMMLMGFAGIGILLRRRRPRRSAQLA
jgi:hypothetical protein